jgi:BTB/POZ domain
MFTIPPKASSIADDTLANIPFDYPGADIILRSQDSHDLQVPKSFILNNSPVLGELVRGALRSPDDTNGESLPVLQLPDRGKMLHCLFTFILPVTPVIPSTHEEVMELLSVAQKYQMDTILIHIRGSIARQNPMPTHLEPALRMHSLAQKYGLRPEALQTARNILQHSMTIENFDDMLDLMPGASFYELLQYYERVRAILASDLTEFKGSAAYGTIRWIRCTARSSSQVPSWIDDYIESIGTSPNLFDLVEFNAAMSSHIKATAATDTCECLSIPSRTIRNFWEALTSVVESSYDKVSVVDVPSYLGC